MEVIHCDNCGFKISADAFSSGTAVYSDDGKIYCSKCAPLFKFATTALQKVLPPSDALGNETTGDFSPLHDASPAPSVMKFFFCETCGKRITDRQIEEGQGRDKKLKGIYCSDCAVGVMTMEMDAISVEQLAKPKSKSKTPLSVTPHPVETKSPLRKGSAIVPESEVPQRPARGKETPDVKKSRLPMLLGIAAVIVVGVSMALVINHQSQPRSPVIQTERHPRLPPPQETAAPGPVAKTSQIPPLKSVPEKNLPVATETPKTIPVEKTAVSVPTTKPAEHTGAPLTIAARPVEPTPTPSVPDTKPPAVAEQPIAGPPVDKHREKFAAILKELVPVLRQNHFAAALELLDVKRRDPAFSDDVELIDKEVADINSIQALRNKAMEALRSKVGTLVTLKKGAMTGTVKVEANRDGVTLSLKDGPELTLSAGQLDIDDVCNLLPIASGPGKAEDLRRFGLLFLAAGDTAKAEDYFTRARDSGPANAATPYLERIAALKLEEREAAALEAWKKAESLFATKNWKAARKAYETFQHDYAGSAALTANAELLKTHLEAIDEALGPLNAVSLDIGGGVKLDLVLIPAGEFMMGSNDGDPNERPAHKVKITHPFYMGKYPVTQAQYEKVMGKNPSRFKGDDLPVDAVNFDAAEEFAKKLSKLIGKTTRLPSEAEWEYACRAGTKTKFHSGDNDAALGQVGWFCGNSENKLHPVGQKKPNFWGLYDMHGNVWQWCHDWMSVDYYTKSPVEDPEGPSQGNDKVFRGGSWSYAAADCRAARRGWTNPANGEGIGLRVVVDPSSKPK